MYIRTVKNGFVVTVEKKNEVSEARRHGVFLTMESDTEEIVFQDLQTLLRFIEEYYGERQRKRDKGKDKKIPKDS